jgi:hypothetical protein
MFSIFRSLKNLLPFTKMTDSKDLKKKLSEDDRESLRLEYESKMTIYFVISTPTTRSMVDQLNSFQISYISDFSTDDYLSIEVSGLGKNLEKAYDEIPWIIGAEFIPPLVY